MFHLKSLWPLLLVASAGVLPAQVKPCPHQIAVEQKVRAVLGPVQQCSGGVNIRFPGVTVNLPPNSCPLWVVFHPAYSTTQANAGSNTYTRPMRRVPVVISKYECKTDYFLIFSLGSACVHRRTINIGTRTHYEQFPCPEEKPQG